MSSQKNPIPLDNAIVVGNWAVYALTIGFLMATFIWLLLPSNQNLSHQAIWSIASWSFQTALGIAFVLFFLKVQQTPNGSDQDDSSNQ